jgi:hypothetical protein
MRGVVQRATRAYLRTGVVAVASAGLLAATFGVASGEDGAPIGPGTAKATAIVAQVAPGVGSLQLGITSGVAVAEIKNTLGQAQAKTLDLGLVGSTLTGESCGNAATISPSDLPQPTRVDSRGGKASLTEDQVPLPGTPLGVGHRVAEASPDPSAKAISDIVQTITGLIDISAGHAEASARAIKGQGREAEAKVSVDLTLAGAIKLSALNWDAYHRSGKDPKATASFDIGTGSLLGLPIPTESLASLETVLNSALEYTGLSITFPKVERFTQPADLIRMTPLTIELRNSQAGHDLLGPILDLTREQREQLFDQIAASFCQASAATLVGGIGLDIAAGPRPPRATSSSRARSGPTRAARSTSRRPTSVAGSRPAPSSPCPTGPPRPRRWCSPPRRWARWRTTASPPTRCGTPPAPRAPPSRSA